jgi:hypothetical protein
VILATVKGDVHDIGKNLVEIILANNGYQVINLGIKVPPEVLIRACQEHQPDAIGLSGLLVKSTQQMVITAGDFKAAGITVPLLVGGAALSEKFTRTKIAPAYGEAVCYAKDAMTGLSLMNAIMDPAERAAVLARATGRQGRVAPAAIAAGAAGTRAAPRCAPASRFPPRPISSAKCAMFRTWPSCGVTSIRSCSMAGTWATKGISKRPWWSTKPRRWNLFHNMEQVKRRSCAIHEGESGVAVLRSRARRQRHPPVRAGRRHSPSTPSASDGSPARTDCA